MGRKHLNGLHRLPTLSPFRLLDWSIQRKYKQGCSEPEKSCGLAIPHEIPARYMLGG